MHWWTGSSPLTRGIHRRTHKAIKKVWFIPAHAGNTRLSGKWAHRAEVHPRSRGEYRLLMPLILTSVGSSPLTRGIQWLGFDGSRTHGFIPAHAGNTPLFPLLTNLNQVHPRSRGEYPIEHLSQKRSLGSSPLTRGIHAAEEQRADQVRFIPAHAGNTLKKALFYLTFSNTHFHISFNF